MTTQYNVMEDREAWAKVKVDTMPPVDRACLMAELIRRDQHRAAKVIGSLGSAAHGDRRTARGRVAYPC